ncbi:MAG: hypothetical protein AMJ94_07150 [Deltaproteobacteria bacterium SM23_61]|nr:MAG: hypothetical protein AMJ94_07150 [Deltaproteobacteria bacterium SM23_61]
MRWKRSFLPPDFGGAHPPNPRLHMEFCGYYFGHMTPGWERSQKARGDLRETRPRQGIFYPSKLLKLCQLDKKLAGIGKIFLRRGKKGK